MSSGFNVLIDYTIFSRCFIVLQLFDTIKNFSGYIEIDILIEIIHKIWVNIKI
jgi:hypothetical protein